MNKQISHYNRIIESYDETYFDDLSVRYREEFFFKPLFSSISLAGKSLLEIGCGSGLNIKYLSEKYPDLTLYGCDISNTAILRFQKNNPGHSCFVADITGQDFGFRISVDICLGIGILHHCVRNLRKAFENIYDILSPDGVLMLIEPNGSGWINFIRNLWYRYDKKYFDSENEKAFGVDEVLNIAMDLFSVETIKYFGGPAYFLVLNSLIFRCTKSLKSLLFPALMFSERRMNYFSGKHISPLYTLRLKKKG